MESSVHPLSQLFAQLGLPDDDDAIERFIRRHAPLPGEVRLADAPFWSPSQSAFLCSALTRDADWAGTVDALDALLRHPRA